MRNIWKIFIGDLKKIKKNAIAWIVILGLSVVPSLYAWFNIAASYSPIQAGGKSFGLALKLGALFLGTDYMYFGNSSKAVNAFIGLSIPLGKSRD